MTNSIRKTVLTSLAAFTVGLVAVASAMPASADVYSGRNGQTPGAFAAPSQFFGEPAARVAPENFRAFFDSATQPTHQCYDMTQLRQKSGNTGYSAAERC